MPDDTTFRERMPAVAKMINLAFNGDAGEDDELVTFVLIASKRMDERGADVIAMINNLAMNHDVVSLLFSAIAQYADKPEQPVGHA